MTTTDHGATDLRAVLEVIDAGALEATEAERAFIAGALAALES
ncbi:hypothetical protein [Arthrobacter mobilis]|nr:hypothetical protein [Arthrobacter mobilis]